MSDRYNTNNPVPSNETRDFSDNSRIVDELVHLQQVSTPDRFGIPLKTWFGINQDAKNAILNLGWHPVGTFQAGATLNTIVDVIQDERSFLWYRWDNPNTLPKIVPADSTPESTGGIGAGVWVAVEFLASDTPSTPQEVFSLSEPLGEGADLNTYLTPGLYYQNSIDLAMSGINYPEPTAGSLEIYLHAGVTQVYRIYIGSRTYIRTHYNGAWSSWAMCYDTENPPPAADLSNYYTKPESDARYQLINTASNTSNGWHIDSSTGVMEQWGYAPAGVDAVLFPVAFSWQCHSVVLTATNAGQDTATNIEGLATTTGFMVGNGNNAGVYWRAIGG